MLGRNLRRAGGWVGLLAAMALGAASAGQGHVTAAAATPQAWHFVTRPDLTPPVMSATTASGPGLASRDRVEGQDVFLGPKDTDTGVTMQGEAHRRHEGQPGVGRQLDGRHLQVPGADVPGQAGAHLLAGTST